MIIKKQSGAYYTPERLATWLVGYVKESLPESTRILEPGCGDGSFLRALDKLFLEYTVIIDAIELDKKAINEAKNNKFKQVINYTNEDFLFWNSSQSYDLIIGNPPYVVKKRLSKKQAAQCKKIHVDSGLKEKEVANLWTAFLVKSISLLSESGLLAFVLPNEILQVKYAEEVRELLLERFKRVEVVSFKKLAFSDIDQDTVLLICYAITDKQPGSFFTEVQSVDELHNCLDFQEISSPNSTKWTANILSKNELTELNHIAEQFKKSKDFCNSVAGIVTAANSFFIVNSSTVEKYNLQPYVKAIIQKGMHVNGSMEFAASQYKDICNKDTPCWLLDLNGIPEHKFNKGLISYLQEGTSSAIDKRYKCLLRNRWFDVPSIWKSEGFFFKRSYHYPKLLTNSADVYVTDAAYRIKMLEDYKVRDLCFSFYNSLTLSMAEIGGRYYGGGVLELTPNEFKSLPIPYVEIKEDDYKKQLLHFENKKSIEDVLYERDEIILQNKYNFGKKDIETIQNIYSKLKSRRIRG